MKKETQDRIVKIVIPLMGGSSLYFSGYIIGNGMILTCQHGFVSKSNSHYDTNKKIQISSSSIETTIPLNVINLQGLVDEEIVCFASVKYDIALLACESDSLKVPYQNLHLTELDADHGYQWIAGGYPFFNKDEKETQGYKHFSGKCESVEQKATKISLTVNIELVEMANWNEASGSPIFIDNKLAGIVRKYTNEVRHELKASYLKRLWDDPNEPEFRRILEPLQHSHLSSIKHCVEQKIYDTAKDFLKQNEILTFSLAKQGESTDQTLDRLCAKNLLDLLSDLENRKKGAAEDIQQKISVFALKFLPYYFSDKAVIIDKAIQQKYEATIDLACVSDVAVEFSLASFDSREANIKLIAGDTSSENQLVVEGRKYALSPETGIDQANEDKLAMTKQMLSGSALDVELKRFSKGRFRANPEKQINRHLKKARESGNSFYLVICLDKADLDYKSNLAKMKQYHATYPDLIIVGLSLDEAVGEEEDNDLFTLLFIIE